MCEYYIWDKNVGARLEIAVVASQIGQSCFKIMENNFWMKPDAIAPRLAGKKKKNN